MTLFRSKLRAFLIHLALSLLLAGLAAALVFGVWFPYPYRELSGGRELFLLIVSVDVVLGPLITFTVFNPAKSRREKLLDFSVIGLLQLGALVYGLWTVAQARPVHMAFEYDRFRVVHAVDVPLQNLDQAPAGLRTLPWTGPSYVSLRPMTVREQLEMTMAALGGVALSARPELWQPYEDGRGAILKAARPASELAKRFAHDATAINEGIARSGRSADALRYLPIQGRKGVVWTVLLDAETAQPVGFLPLDSF